MGLKLELEYSSNIVLVNKTTLCLMITEQISALSGWHSSLEHHAIHQEAAASIPGWGM